MSWLLWLALAVILTVIVSVIGNPRARVPSNTPGCWESDDLFSR
jgi:hypothetical protein